MQTPNQIIKPIGFTISEITDRIADEITRIKNAQQPDGSFFSLPANNVALKNAATHKTIFSTALILSCLGNSKNNYLVEEIAHNGLGFLSYERNKPWSWNYWPREVRHESRKSTAKKIPDDMDDTFTALLAFHIHRPKGLTTFAVKSIREHLQKTGRSSTGLYNTWILDEYKYPRWNESDIVVNSTIGHFLNLRNINTSGIATYILKTLMESDEKRLSRYYPSRISALYFISRFLGRKLAGTKFPVSRKITPGMSTLEVALILSTLMHLGEPKENLSPLIEYILKNKCTAHGLYVESIKNGTPFYAGSAALTSAFCVEALSAYILYNRHE